MVSNDYAEIGGFCPFLANWLGIWILKKRIEREGSTATSHSNRRPQVGEALEETAVEGNQTT